MHGEDRLLAWLRRLLGPESRLGDDAALLAGDGPWVATVDSQIEGVHFPPGLDPRRVARRLLAVNLSDLAASGAEPAYALLALAAPGGFDHKPFFRALVTACRDHRVELAGGDLAKSPAGLAATLTLLGRLPPGGARLARRGTRPADALWLAGSLGESAAGRRLLELGARPAGRGVTLPAQLGLAGGLAAAAKRAVRRHLLPRPRLELGLALGRRAAAAPRHPPAAIDVSDGLATDLARLCRESAVGAVVDADRLPLPPRFAALCERLELEPLATALGGGEDYALLFTLAPGDEPPAGHGAVEIGRIEAGSRLLLRHEGRSGPLPDLGWDHLGG